VNSPCPDIEEVTKACAEEVDHEEQGPEEVVVQPRFVLGERHSFFDRFEYPKEEGK